MPKTEQVTKTYDGDHLFKILAVAWILRELAHDILGPAFVWILMRNCAVIHKPETECKKGVF